MARDLTMKVCVNFVRLLFLLEKATLHFLNLLLGFSLSQDAILHPQMKWLHYLLLFQKA